MCLFSKRTCNPARLSQQADRLKASVWHRTIKLSTECHEVIYSRFWQMAAEESEGGIMKVDNKFE
jgi:hypothetical protein